MGMQVVRHHPSVSDAVLEQLGRHLVAATSLPAVLPHLLVLRLLMDHHAHVLADYTLAVKVLSQALLHSLTSVASSGVMCRKR